MDVEVARLWRQWSTLREEGRCSFAEWLMLKLDIDADEAVRRAIALYEGGHVDPLNAKPQAEEAT